MRAKKVRVLVDVDGVLADFLHSALEVVELRCGELVPPHTTKYTKDHIVTWDIFDHVPREIEAKCTEDFAKKGFCEKLLILPGSKEGMAALQNMADVFIVTSPMNTPHWVWERTNWVKDHFGISPRKVVHCSSKYLVRGDVLIDDRMDNVRDWLEHHPDGLGILWAAPYNKSETLPPSMVRTDNWKDALAYLEAHAKGLK